MKLLSSKVPILSENNFDCFVFMLGQIHLYFLKDREIMLICPIVYQVPDLLLLYTVTFTIRNVSSERRR